MKSLYDRFVNRINKNGDNSCWLWTGYIHRSYGIFYCQGKQYLAHRKSYELFVGPIPYGMCVCHRCDNPPCVNPDHLFIGTRADNNIDMVSKGRQRSPSGENRKSSKLTRQNAEEIRKLYGIYKLKELAVFYGVSKSAIYSVIHNKTWKDSNFMDKSYKNIHADTSGTFNGRAKLNWNDIDYIRDVYNNTEITYAQLGERFGVTKECIYQIIKNRSWKTESRKLGWTPKTTLEQGLKLTKEWLDEQKSD